MGLAFPLPNDSDHSYFGIWNDPPRKNRNYAWENFTTGNQVLFTRPVYSTPQLWYLILQIASSPLDKRLHPRDSAVEISCRARPKSSVQFRCCRGFRFELVKDRKQLGGGKFLVEQFGQPVQESKPKLWLSEKPFL